MRYLNRPNVIPAGLLNYNYVIDKWNKTTPDKNCKDAIWSSLQLMQNGFCAYCEGTAVSGNGHIEHFFHKGRKPDGSTPYKHLTFDWNNLFGSCGFRTGNTCGHYKDKEGTSGPGIYNPSQLIKPDIHDPKMFFRFLETGAIEPKPGLSQVDLDRASETIRVLNLSSLKAARKRQIDRFKKELTELAAISDTLDGDALKNEINLLIDRAKQQEFQTAVIEALFM